MASQFYGIAYDTPYNREIADELTALNMARDTNGEPDNFVYVGGSAFVRHPIYHPHLVHPLYHARAGEMDDDELEGGIKWKKVGRAIRKGLGHLGKTKFVKEIGRDVKGALKNVAEAGIDRAEQEALDYIHSGAGIYSAGYYPHGGFVPPHEASPPRYVMAGVQGHYPFYNAVEMASLDGRGVPSGGNFLKKLGKSVGHLAGDVAKDVGSTMVKDALYTAPLLLLGGAEGQAEAPKRGRGRPRKTGGNLKSVAKKVGRAVKKVAKSKAVKKGAKALGKELKDIVEPSAKRVKQAGKERLKQEVEGAVKKVEDKAMDIVQKLEKKPMEGAGKRGRGRPKKDLVRSAIDDIEDLGYIIKSKSKSGAGVPSGGAVKKVDGRKKRAEIVKKVMREKGLKMTDASKYVKQHGLY